MISIILVFGTGLFILIHLICLITSVFIDKNRTIVSKNKTLIKRMFSIIFLVISVLCYAVGLAIAFTSSSNGDIELVQTITNSTFACLGISIALSIIGTGISFAKT